ncbi:MAG: winged helix-turn-helix domain-containing protein [Halanaerobiales bacterium]
MTKPFSPRELVARVKAVLKRYDSGGKDKKQGEENIKYPDLIIYPASREVKVKGKEIELSPKEYDLLYLLASHPRQVFARERMYERVWGMESYGDYRSVDVHINWLRDKLELDYIKTVWGIGYKFEVDS